MVGLGVNVVVIIAGVFVFEKRLSFVCLGEEKDRCITVIISVCGVVWCGGVYLKHFCLPHAGADVGCTFVGWDSRFRHGGHGPYLF